MPTTYRFPALVWQDAAGCFSASVVECSERVSLGRSVKEALEQLRDLLEWRYRQEPWRDPPDLEEAELLTLKIAIRPEYFDEKSKRRSPLNEPYELRVPCVIGTQSSGLRLAAAPLLDLRWNVHEQDDIKALITHSVQQRLQGLTPQQLSRFVPPGELRLEDLFVSVERRRDPTRPMMKLEKLPCVAEPLGDPKVRALFGRAWERDREVHQLAARLMADRASILLLGESGCGKTTLLCEALRQVERQLGDQDKADDDSWERKPNRRFWQTSAGRLISGMKYLGQWEERLEEVIRELHEIEGTLCVESLLDLVRVGGREPTDSLAAFCIPYIQRGELRLLAETSPTELDACRRLLPGLVDLFQVATVAPLDRSATTRVLTRISDVTRSVSEGASNAQSPSLAPRTSDLAAERTVQLFHRFEPYRALPGDAVPFWRDLLERAAREKLSEVTSPFVVSQFSRRTGISELFLHDERPLPRDEVLTAFRRDIIEQDAACEAAADVVIQFKSSMNDPHRPLGVLLFSGPTGVGKTELAKSMSRYLFGEANRQASGGRLIRLDMSEYSSPWAADRLLLQANGEPSEFIQRIRRQPFSVVLFDEIEKAHPDIFDVLMNVFDEGRLTDRFGRATIFRSAVIVLTSNLGATSSSQLGFGERSDSGRYEAAAREFFRPEFFNRLDAVVRFHSLPASAIEAITEKELREIASREGLQKLNLRLSWSREVVAHLAQTGFDSRYGARPLQRAIENQVVTPLARLLLDGRVAAGTTVTLNLSSGGQIALSS
ncbi:MAG: AAA family ATPase [Planctomycetaceae bacterium]